MKENNLMSYEMYEDFKETMVKTLKNEIAALVPAAQPIDMELPQRIEQIVGSEQERHRTIMTRLAGRLERIEQNHVKMQAGMDNLQSSVAAIEIPAELPPRITRHRISLAIESQGVFWSIIGMMVAIAVLCVLLCQAAKPNWDRIDNDLKYRYIKMKGEASPDRIAELEEIFELHRDNGKIRQMKKDVGEYEQTIRQKIVLEEQARMKAREAEQLNKKASQLKREHEGRLEL
jgi:hypothetical protein